MGLVCFRFLYISAIIGVYLGHTACAKFTYCAFHDDDMQRGRKNSRYTDEHGTMLANSNVAAETGEIQNDNKTIKCTADKNFCYTFWQADPKTNISLILKQGCWDHPDRTGCTESECLNNRPQTRNNTKFCCCTGDLCNVNVTDIYQPSMDTTVEPRATPAFHFLPDSSYQKRTIIIALSSVCGVAVFVVLIYLIYRIRLSSKKPILENLVLMDSPPSPCYELDELKFDSLIQKGRYGEVWKGQLNNEDVAVKIFSAMQLSYFINERDIYMLPYMEHENLLKFYGAEERVTLEGATQYLIVMSYCPLGSLASYLKNNTLNWSVLCRMCHSAASGLAHLHTDVRKGDKFKPVVAHRDFNTRNILVKADLTCCLCDMGFAMKLMGTRLYRNGQDEYGEQTSLIDVGTLRYMAPEVLDGAVNLRDCESSLKQIDVYALGLVIWEIASRCSDLYQGLPTPEHQLPFQAEVGMHPSLEQMQHLVSRKKLRPTFPDVWKDTHQAIRALKETIEDCWDQDAEARLTAMCVEERIMEMMVLWEVAKYKGVTPTILQGGLPDASIMQRNVTSQSVPSSQLPPDAVGTSSAPIDKNGNLAVVTVQGESSGGIAHVGEYQAIGRARSSVTDHSISTSTNETTLTMSPSEPEVYSKANRNITYALSNHVHQPLQPHQGRNPTVERNTHKRSDEELKVKGNTLVDGDLSESSSVQNYDHIFDSITDNLETSLVQSDLLNQHRPNNPIPYVQNRVNMEPAVVRPKQANVPGNGLSQRHRSEAPKPKSRFKRLKEKGQKITIFGNPVFRGILGGSRKKGTGVCVTSPLETPHPSQQPVEGYSTAEKCNLLNQTDVKMVSTKVFLDNGNTVVRPLDLPLQNGHSESDYSHSNLLSLNEGRLGIAEVGVAKLHSANHGKAAVVKLSNSSKSKSSSETVSSPASSCLSDGNPLQKRPSSLSLNGHCYNESNMDVDNVSSKSTPVGTVCVSDDLSKPGLRIKRRVKTPYTLKAGRFSLYDDRMMSDCCRDTLGKAKPEFILTKSSISLQQFKNSDVDLDALKAADFSC